MVRFFATLPGFLGLDLSKQALDAIELLREYSLRPSKRIRGSLAARSYDSAANVQFGKAGLQLGIALELMQNYLLIVDDVMDKSDTRRGQPTIHKLYETDTKITRDTHESNMDAINVGLLAQHFANIALLQCGEKDTQIVDTMAVVHRHITATGLGQIDDLYQQVGRDVTSEDILRKYSLKSSHYTFINPIESGMTLAGITDSATTKDIRAFGEAAGIVFQLRDDYLGLFGVSSVTGKSNSDDIKDEKYTLLMHHTLSHASPDDLKILKTILGKSDISAKQIAEVQRICIDSGAKDFVQQQMDDYIVQAEDVLRASDIKDEFKQVLQVLVEFSARRES